MAVETALSNYASIKAKNNYLNASKATVQKQKRISAQPQSVGPAGLWNGKWTEWSALRP
jgi:hypothetical protein